MKQFPFMRPELNSALLCFCFVYLTKIERHFSQFCFCDTCFSFTTVFSSTPVSGTVITVQPISFTEQGSGAVTILLNIVFLCLAENPQQTRSFQSSSVLHFRLFSPGINVSTVDDLESVMVCCKHVTSCKNTPVEVSLVKYL